VKDCALKLQGKSLLAKLSSGYLITQEAKHHHNCLLFLCRSKQGIVMYSRRWY